MKTKTVYVADFESRNSDNNIANCNTSVWLWDLCHIETLTHTTGDTMVTFMAQLEKIAPAIVYTHNLKFDGVFVLDYLLKHGYKHSANKTLEDGEFATLITETKVFYSIKICFEAKNKKAKKIVEFRDSTKKISGTVESIAKSYNLPILKGEIDYKLERGENYKATAKEIDYIHNDTEIVARVLKMQYDRQLDRLTTSSDTFNLYKNFCGKHYKLLFPVLPLDVDNFIRKSYRGGVCQVGDAFKEKTVNSDFVYDVNSMYPAQMCNALLPYGKPRYYTGKYKKNAKYALFIQRLVVCCKLKPKHRPTVLMNNSKWQNSDYLIDTNGEMHELTLTSVDLELFFKHYEVYDIKYVDGYEFMGSYKLFKQFIGPLYKGKCESQGAEKQLYKLLLNALYGKFATNPKHIQKIPYLENDTVCFKNSEVEYDEPIYTAVSSFITSYARKQLFTAIQNNYDDFIYCDTDSIHLLHEGKDIEIDQKRLGAWKLETADDPVIKACYLAQKTYFQVFASGKVNIKIAGCPQKVKDKITIDTFKFGNAFSGKLLPKTVNGGVVLRDTEFTIKRR